MPEDNVVEEKAASNIADKTTEAKVDQKSTTSVGKLSKTLSSDIKSTDVRRQLIAGIILIIISAVLVEGWNITHPTTTTTTSTIMTTTTVPAPKPYIAVISDVASQFPKNAVVYITNPSNQTASTFAFYFRTSNYSDATLSLPNNTDIKFPYEPGSKIASGSNIYVVAHNVQGGDVEPIYVNFTRPSNITINVTETDATYCNTTFFANYYSNKTVYNEGYILLNTKGNCSSLILSKFEQTFPLTLNLSGPTVAYSRQNVLGLSENTNNGLAYTVNAIKQNSSDYSYWVDGVTNQGYWYQEGVIFDQELNKFYGVNSPFLGIIQIWIIFRSCNFPLC